MSTHDRGAFGALLAEAKALLNVEMQGQGPSRLLFDVDLNEPDESEDRWGVINQFARDGRLFTGRGRTGEEALRRLVEKLRT